MMFSRSKMDQSSSIKDRQSTENLSPSLEYVNWTRSIQIVRYDTFFPSLKLVLAIMKILGLHTLSPLLLASYAHGITVTLYTPGNQNPQSYAVTPGYNGCCKLHRSRRRKSSLTPTITVDLHGGTLQKYNDNLGGMVIQDGYQCTVWE